MMSQIIGSGGGGKSGAGGGGISEDPDTLASVAAARFLDLICEGPIKGFHQAPNADYSIYLDGVPLKDTTGTVNYRPYTFQFTTGTPGQPVLDGFANVQQEASVGLKVTTGLGIVARSIPDAGADSVRVTVAVNGLSLTDSQGRITGTSIQYEVYTRVAAGTWRLSVANTINEKTRSRAQIQHEILLSDLGAGPYEVGVKRITSDSASSLLVNDLFWDSYTIINYEKLNYPYSVLCGVMLDARYFSNVPVRTYHIKGMLVKVPTNCVDANGDYDWSYKTTGAGTTAGAWDGTFVTAYCDNPVWCLYDVLTNKRYGLGKRLMDDATTDTVNGGLFASGVDKWAMYQIAKYCDQYVSTGYDSDRLGYTKNYGVGSGGNMLASVPTSTQVKERRFTMNCLINTMGDAYKVINDICSVFRGMAYWSSGALTLSQDSPGTPTIVFTNSNVHDSRFEYEGSSRADRHTSVTVAWNDPSEDFVRKFEYIEDVDSIRRYGYRPTEVTAFACTSRGQARRLGRYILLTERLDSEMIHFSAGMEAAQLRPGSIISIMDNDRLGLRWGGRLASHTTNLVLQSQTFDNASWAKSALTAVTANVAATTAPDGTSTADKITESSVTSGTHSVQQNIAGFKAGQLVTWSCYLKAAERTEVQFRFFPGTAIALTGYATINLTTGTVSPVNLDRAPTSVSAGNGWWRVSATMVMTNDGTLLPSIFLLASGLNTYAGTIGSGVYAWGAQLEVSDVAGVYMPTTTTPRSRMFFDTPPFVPNSGDYTFACLNRSGTFESRVTTIGAPGNIASVDVDGLTTLPVPFAVWSISSASATPVTARVVSIKEESPVRYSIVAVESNQTKYNAIDLGEPVTDGSYSFLSVKPPESVVNLLAKEYAYKPTVTSLVRSDVLVSWDKLTNPTIRGYRIKATSGAETRRYPEALEPRITLDNLPAATYVITVEAVNQFGVPSPLPTSVTLVVTNLDTTAPANVTGFSSSIDAVFGLKLSWNLVADFIDYYEVRVGSAWATAAAVDKVSSSSLLVGSKPAGTYTYWVAAVDTSGNPSAAPTSLTVNLTVPTAPSVAATAVGTDEVIEWSGAASLIQIDRYEIRYGASWAAGVYVTTTKGNSYRRPISYTGTRLYWVAAIDSAGNVGVAGSDTVESIAPAAPVISSALIGDRLRLSWTTPSATLPIVRYEVRYGTSFAAGTQIFTGQSLSFDFEVAYLGSRTYWVAAYDNSGSQGTAGSIDFVVTAPGAVGSSRSEVVDNNALLYWNAPSIGTLPISRYEVRKGASWAAGTVVGSNGTSTFTTIFEQQGGTVLYWIAAYDTANNVGTPVAITAAISQPPDYVLFNDYVSAFAGTKTNLALVDGYLLGPLDANATNEMHFGGGLLSSPTDFSTWTVTNGTLTANAENDAGGFATADRINRTAVGDHFMQRTYVTTSHGGKAFTFSVGLRLGTMTGNIAINIRDGGGTVIAAVSVAATTTLTRFSVTGTFGASPAANIILTINPDNNTGTIGDTFFVSDAQLVQAAAAQPFWRTVNDQATAGFAVYAQPALTTAVYQETIDYGADLASTQVTAALSSEAVAGSVAVAIQLEYKKSGDANFTSMPANASTYLAAGGLRYLRVTYTLTGAAGVNLIKLTALRISLNLKLKTDSQRGTTILGGAHTQGNLTPYKDWIIQNTLAAEGSLGANWVIHGAAAGETVTVDEAGPGGVTHRIARCVQVTPSAGTWDGAIRSVRADVDNTQVYMFSCFIQKNTTNGTLLFGPDSTGAGSERFETLAGVAQINAYFVSSTSIGTAATWYLVVGLVHEVGYAGGQTTISGVYDMSGTRQALNPVDYRWRSLATIEGMRCGINNNSVDVASTITARLTRPAIIKTTRAAAPSLIQKMIKDAVSYGKEVTFGTQFVDIRALSPTLMGSDPGSAISDFIDVPYPTACNVYTFDNAGNRVSREFSIMARGV